MADIWFTSDHHFGHRNIMRYEPHRLSLGETLAEHDEALVTLHNELVSPGDTVIHLGDLAMGDKSVSLHTASRMHGKKFLVPGNHDSFGRASRRQRPELYEEHGFTPAPDIWHLHPSLGGLLGVVACHYPHKATAAP